MLQLMTSQAATLKKLESQMGQIASALSSRPPSSLPSDIESNPTGTGQEHCNAITLRSGKQVEVKDKLEEEGSKQVSSDDINLNIPLVVESPFQPKIPFPQRLKKKNIDLYFQKFLGLLKQLHINIPFTEALEQMPKYAKCNTPIRPEGTELIVTLRLSGLLVGLLRAELRKRLSTLRGGLRWTQTWFSYHACMFILLGRLY